MKINLEELQSIYKAYILENTLISRKNCPSFKKLISFFTSTTSKKQKINIVDHVTNCYFCLQEFQFIFHLLRFERKLNKDLYKLLFAKKSKSYTKKTAQKSILKPEKQKKFLQFLLKWKYASLLLGVLILISTLIIFQNLKNKEYRTIDFKQINLIEPLNEKYSKSSLLFKWKEFKNSNYYVLELFDESLLPVWKSEKIFKDFVSPPKEIIEKLDENKTYYWMITALLHNGEKVESNMEKFIVID
ncbi:MAG: hypothetical protein ACW97P_03180 [Candidatus Hodarchaeales archaeon]